MMRGLEDVDVITPNEGPLLTVLFGFPKFAVFVRLKISALNTNLLDSVTAIVRSNAISMLCCPGPRTRPTPLLPKSVSKGLVPLGASGAEVNAAGFRYWPRTRE